MPQEIVEMLYKKAELSSLSLAATNKKLWQNSLKSPLIKFYQIALGLLKEGYALAKTLENKSSPSFNSVISVLTLFDRGKALLMSEQAVKEANTISIMEEKAEAIVSIAAVLAPLDLKKTLELVNSTPTNYQAHAYAKMALSLAEDNKEKTLEYIALALELTEKLTCSSLKSPVLVTIVCVLKKIDPSKVFDSAVIAIESAKLIADDLSKIKNIKSIALTIASIYPRKALELSDTFPSDQCRAAFDISAEVLKCFADHDPISAKMHADNISSPYHKVKTHINIAHASKDPEQALIFLQCAENSIQEVNSIVDKVDLFIELAKAYVLSNPQKACLLALEALKLMQSLDTPEKASLFINSAKKLAVV